MKQIQTIGTSGLTENTFSIGGVPLGPIPGGPPVPLGENTFSIGGVPLGPIPGGPPVPL